MLHINFQIQAYQLQKINKYYDLLHHKHLKDPDETHCNPVPLEKLGYTENRTVNNNIPCHIKPSVLNCFIVFLIGSTSIFRN